MYKTSTSIRRPLLLERILQGQNPKKLRPIKRINYFEPERNLGRDIVFYYGPQLREIFEAYKKAGILIEKAGWFRRRWYEVDLDEARRRYTNYLRKQKTRRR